MEEDSWEPAQAKRPLAGITTTVRKVKKQEKIQGKKGEVYGSGCPLNWTRASEWSRIKRKVKNINGRMRRLDMCKYCMVKTETNDAEGLLFLAVRDHNTSNNSGDDDQQKDEKTETDPSLFASSSSRRYRLVRGPNPG